MEPNHSPQSLRNSIAILPINKIQAYEWGCKDKSCFVGQMTEKQLQTYAQFWMGTHPNGESKLSSQVSLKEYLASRNIPEIEFLFKILSIEKCLSIQAHPNEQQAQKLYQQFPQIYVDAKDKPQMFLTLSDKFELFLGFIDQKQFQLLEKIQPFQTMASQIGEIQHKQKLIKLLQKLIHLNQNQLKDHIQTLKINLKYFEEGRQKVTLRILKEYGFDTGILVSFILQYHILQKGSCYGIQAGVPHAYVKGECFQLMKNSDNVVRLGLTPKKKDIPNLMKIIKNNIARTYTKVQKRQDNLIEKFQWNSYSILKIKLVSQLNKIQIDTNSIGLVFYGQATIILPLSGQLLTKASQKTVFFLHKGSYTFQGQGQIVIASKA